MKYSDFLELADLTDNDVLLVHQDSTSALRKIKLSTLKNYMGVPTTAPLLPTTGAIKWYRMDDLTTTGALITSIRDKINENNLIPLIGNPTLVANSINGKPSANFNTCAMKSGSQTYVAKNFFIVYRNNTTTYDEFNGYLSIRQDTYNNTAIPISNEYCVISGVKNTNKIYIVSTTGGYIDNVAQNVTLLGDFNQGVSAGTVGSFHIVETVQNNSVSGVKNLAVGMDTNSTPRTLKNSDIAEIIIYPFVLSQEQRTETYKYFKQRYAFSFL